MPNQYEYSLDLAFSSAMPVGPETGHGGVIFALGYGWAKSVDSNSYVEKAQKTERVQTQQPIYFTLFDGASPSSITEISQLVITFKPDGTTTTPLSNSAGEQLSNPITENQINRPPNWGATKMLGSAGCNTFGYAWQAGPYYLIPNIADNTIYRFTVAITILLADGSTKTFKVDPKMIVGGGG
jgi:hypothetical protein